MSASSESEALRGRATAGWWLRVFATLISTGVLATVAIRTAVVAGGVDENSSLASRVAPAHPNVLSEQVMIEVAQAAKQGKNLSAATDQKLRLLSRTAPLAPEPYAIRGASAMRAGNYREAEQLLLAARLRNPRTLAVRYLLADLYLRQAKTMPAVQELLVLSDLAPEMTSTIAAMLADFAYTPNAEATLSRALRQKPLVEAALLSHLAIDARNVGLILRLASNTRSKDGLLDWQQKLIFSLIKAAQFRKAFALWREFSGRKAAPAGDFSDSAGKSPFTWTIVDSEAATAAPRGKNLEARFFGRSNVTVASKVLVLTPGEYRLRFRVTELRGDGTSLRWVIGCLPAGNRLVDLPLSKPLSRQVAVTFRVSKDCEAQELKLLGVAQIDPSEVAVELADLMILKAS